MIEKVRDFLQVKERLCLHESIIFFCGMLFGGTAMTFVILILIERYHVVF